MKVLKHCTDLGKIIVGLSIANIMKVKKENRDVWLISERRDEAEDNGYHLFKYIRENHSEEKVFYVIDKKSESYKKIKKYRNIVNHNSIEHYIYYFLADKHISAFQFFGVPETVWLWKLEEKGLIKKKKVFLQHGITKEDLPFLKFNQTNYRLFICGAKKEYEYIKKKFGYPDKNLKYTGFARFDNLHEYKEKKQILLMPTWRSWLGMDNADNDAENEKIKFTNSEYFKIYSSLINNNILYELLKKEEFELIFYPHPEMQRFIKCFNSDNNIIKVANRKRTNLQELIKESQIIITDYSSIAFDGAYMGKKLIYYQFDSNEYYKDHFTKGYFDCERDGFGDVVKSEKNLIKNIKKYIISVGIEEKYIERSKQFFPLHDMFNCKRNYDEIKKI
ncbi:MAG: CDP-glycerol glycerophosphotransferase family protein [Romboutsia sp.]